MGLTKEQKELVVEYRIEGYGYAAISRMIGTTGSFQVRDYCRTKSFFIATNGEYLETTKIGIDRQCETCKKTFESLSDKHIYCNSKCNVKTYIKAERKFKCKTCGSEGLKNGYIKYCSEDCKPKPKEKRTVCKCCGDEFLQFGNKSFCSSECRKKERRKRNAHLYENRVCMECDKIFEVRKTDKHKYCGIKCWHKSTRMEHKEFAIKLSQRHNGMIIPLEVIDGTKMSVLCKCLSCGNEFNKRISEHLDRGCNFCSGGNDISEGELNIREYLNSKSYDFEEEYSFDDLKVKRKLRYDFAIKSRGIIVALIEYDGRQHFEPVEAWGGEEELARNILHDEMKNDYAKVNGIKLIRVKYTEKNIFGFLDEALQGGEWNDEKDKKYKR